MKKVQHPALVLLVGLITAFVSYFKSGRVEATILFNIGLITTIFGATLILFNSFVWNFSLLYPWFVDVPSLGGSWKVKARILKPGSSGYEDDTGEASIDQSYSELYMSVVWSDGSETEFFEAAALAISGKRMKRCALSSVYQFRKGGMERVMRNAAIAFDVPAKLFENRPGRFTLFYATTDGYRGELELSR